MVTTDYHSAFNNIKIVMHSMLKKELNKDFFDVWPLFFSV